MHNFARATNSVGCLFYPRDQAQALDHLPVSPDIKEFIASYVNERWYLQDVRAIKGWPTFAKSNKLVFTDDDFTTPEELRSSPYFQELHSEWGLPNWAAIAFKVKGDSWAMPLLRSKSQGWISPADARVLAAASPHLAHVVELAAIMGARLTSERLAVLHHSGTAAALLDWRGNLLGLTASGERLLDSDLVIEKRRLSARDRSSNMALQNLIAAALAGRLVEASLDTVGIVRRGRRPLVVKAIPLMPALGAAFGQASLLLLLTDLEKEVVPRADLLRDLFGLTPAEARLALELARGNALDEAADRLAIGKETARGQLKSIFQKTDTHRQSQLMALIAKLPPT